MKTLFLSVLFLMGINLSVASDDVQTKDDEIIEWFKHNENEAKNFSETVQELLTHCRKSSLEEIYQDQGVCSTKALEKMLRSFESFTVCIGCDEEPFPEFIYLLNLPTLQAEVEHLIDDNLRKREILTGKYSAPKPPKEYDEWHLDMLVDKIGVKYVERRGFECEVEKKVGDDTSPGEKIWRCHEVTSKGWEPTESGELKVIDLEPKDLLIKELDNPPYLQTQDDHFVIDGCEKYEPGSVREDWAELDRELGFKPYIAKEVSIDCSSDDTTFYFYPTTGLADYDVYLDVD